MRSPTQGLQQDPETITWGIPETAGTMMRVGNKGIPYRNCDHRGTVFFCPRHGRSWFSGLQTPGLTPIAFWFLGLWPQTGSYTIGSSDSQDFGHRLNCIISFLGSPAFRQKIVGPFSLHNKVSHYYKKYLLLYLPINKQLLLFLWTALTKKHVTWSMSSIPFSFFPLEISPLCFLEP